MMRISLYICIIIVILCNIQCQDGPEKDDVQQYSIVKYDICLDEEFLEKNNIVPADRKGASIIIETNLWDSIIILSHINRILLTDAMGFKTQWNEVTAKWTLQRIDNGDSHVSFETWTAGKENLITKYVENKKSVSEVGIGTTGASGWYTASRTIKDNPDSYFDFWRVYKKGNLTNLSNIGSTSQDEIESAYYPPWCAPIGTEICVELLALYPAYDIGINEQMIYNLGLRVGLLYLGSNFTQIVKRKYNAGEDFLFYNWYPNLLTSQLDVERIFLQQYSSECYSNNLFTNNGANPATDIGGIGCDFPGLPLVKIFPTRWRNDDIYGNAYSFFENFVLERNTQSDQLREFGNNYTSEEHVKYACAWVRENVDVWKPTIKNVEIVSIGQGTKTLMFVISLVLIFFLAIMLLLVLMNLKHKVIITSSKYFCCTIIIGGIILSSYVTLASLDTDSCSPLTFLFGFGYTLLFSSLVLKTWRINAIFNKAEKRKQKKIQSQAMVIKLCLLLGLEIFIQIAWLLFDEQQYVLEKQDPESNLDKYVYRCSSEYNALWLILYSTPKIAIFLYGIVLAYKIRNVDDNFNESKNQFVLFVVIFLLSAVMIPVSASVANLPETYLIMSGIATLVIAFMGPLVLLAPKLWSIYITKDFHNQRHTKYELDGTNTQSYPSTFDTTTGSGDVQVQEA